jgi:hypothetical protein
MKSKYIIILLTSFVSLTTFAKPEVTASTGYITSLNNQSPVTPNAVSSNGFEVSDGFTAGPINGQVGWATFTAATPTIESTNPALGSQQMRISADGSVGQGSNTGGFSPNMGVQNDTLSASVNVDMLISATGGADYDVVGQAPSQGFLTWRVKFGFLGNISILDDTGAGLAFIDTGIPWPVNTYFNLQIVSNPVTDSIDYFIDGNLIYSGVAGIFAGTTIEQVVILSDNFQIGDSGDFDNLVINNAYIPPSVPIPTLNMISILLMMFAFVFTYRRFSKV